MMKRKPKPGRILAHGCLESILATTPGSLRPPAPRYSTAGTIALLLLAAVMIVLALFF